MSRLKSTFDRLKAENRAAFIPFVMGGDPDAETSSELIARLPEAGADIIEIGVPFTDPMADGPAIQLAGQRALEAGQTLAKTLTMVRSFRAKDDQTAVVLMGYYNPFYAYGPEKFVRDAVAAGVDGLIIVDLPPEEDAELCLPAKAAGLDFVRLATPTTDDERLPAVLQHASGFVYYVSVAGITGGATGASSSVSEAVKRLKRESGLPVAVGFGIKTEERAAEIAQHADAVVVGSALVDTLARHLPDDKSAAVKETVILAEKLGHAIRNARKNG